MTKYFNIKSLRISKKTYFFVSGEKEVYQFYYVTIYVFLF